MAHRWRNFPFHVGLTLFGTRTVQVEVGKDNCNEPMELLQRPGSFCVGNLMVFKQNVKHTAKCHGCFQVQGAHHGVQIAITAQTDVFRAGRAHKRNSRPEPKALFDLINNAVATHLADKPLPMPSLAAVLAEAHKNGVLWRG